MRNTLFLFIISLILFSCDFKSSEYYNKEAEKLEQLGEYEDAILLLNKAIEKNGENIYALINRGVDKSILGDYKGAIDDYNRVLEIDSDNTVALLNRGNNKNRLEDYSGAINDYNAAIATKGEGAFYIDWVYNPSFDTGYEFDVSMQEIRFRRGIANSNIDSLYSAFEDFDFCIQKNFELALSYYYRGAIYIAYDMQTEGCKDLQTSMDLGDSDAKELFYESCK